MGKVGVGDAVSDDVRQTLFAVSAPPRDVSSPQGWSDGGSPPTPITYRRRENTWDTFVETCPALL